MLAYNEWNGTTSLPEILAAFVLPNHPALAPILVHHAQEARMYALVATAASANLLALARWTTGRSGSKKSWPTSRKSRRR